MVWKTFLQNMQIWAKNLVKLGNNIKARQCIVLQFGGRCLLAYQPQEGSQYTGMAKVRRIGKGSEGDGPSRAARRTCAGTGLMPSSFEKRWVTSET